MKGRKHRETGGSNEAADDMKTKPEARTNASKIDSEAEERKAGGRVGRKGGGMVSGDKACRSDRKPRASGGSATSNPFSSARKGTLPPGHKAQMCD